MEAAIARLAPRGRPNRPALTLAWSGRPTSDFAAAAFENKPLLWRQALRLCRCPNEASDLIQDTFERALRAWPRLRPDSDVRAWLASILRNRFLDARRRRRLELGGPEASDAMARAAAAEPDPQPEPSWISITEEQLGRAVDRLGEPFRRVYLLHAREGRPYAEIARHLGIPTATVGTRLARARRKLRTLLQTDLRVG